MPEDNKSRIPSDPIGFIRDCVHNRAVFWTYHVNMRMEKRSIERQVLLNTIETFEILESYPDDKYLPSYLIYLSFNGQIFHAVIAVDVPNSNVRIVTLYAPDPEQWSDDMKRRVAK